MDLATISEKYGRMANSIRSEFLTFLADTGMSVAEFSRRSGVTYDSLNKLKQRDDAGTGDENARKIRSAIASFYSESGTPTPDGFEEPPPPQIDIIGALAQVDEPKNLPDDAVDTIKIAVVNGIIQVAATVDLNSFPRLLRRLENARKMAADEE